MTRRFRSLLSALTCTNMRFPVLLLAPALALAACTSRDRPTSNTAAGGTLIVPTLADASNIFPPFVTEQISRIVQDQVFDRLAEIDTLLNTVGDKTFSPRLAQKWAWSNDSLSIAFSINPSARWHDGKPVTASDVRYSFRLFTDPKVGSPSAPLLSNVDSVSVRDSLTAVAWFKKRTPQQFYDVAYQLVIVPEHVYGSIPLEQLHTSEKTRTLIGSGRFRFLQWDAGTRIEIVADTSNYRGRAKLDRVIFVPTDVAAAAAQVLSGQADFMEAFPLDQAAQLDSNEHARGILVPQLGYVFLALNRHARKSASAPHPILSDARVRRALSMGVDRESMLRNVFGTTGHLSHGPFPMTATYADSSVTPPPFDTVAAKAMLDSSGWRAGPDGMRSKNGVPLHFSIGTTSSPYRRRYSVLLQEQFRKLGARIEIEQIDNNNAVNVAQAGDFDALLWGFSPDPGASGIGQSWSTAGIGPTGQNLLRYSNPKVDALLDSATASFDPAATKRYTTRAFNLIIADAPAIWLYDISIIDAVNRRVVVTGMRADEWWANLADWTIPADKRIERDRIGLSAPNP